MSTIETFPSNHGAATITVEVSTPAATGKYPEDEESPRKAGFVTAG
jgi:hypothetical protein